MDKLAEYRKIQAEKYAAHLKSVEPEKEKVDLDRIKLIAFFSKYDFEYNKESLASYRIARFVKRRLLISTVNKLKIPGRFIYRVKISNLLWNDLYNIANEINNSEEQRILMEQDLIKLIESPDINFMIDISIYATPDIYTKDKFDMPIIINDEIYYLTTLEKNKINKIWKKINPETEIGKRFHNLLDYSKAFCDAYNSK